MKRNDFARDELCRLMCEFDGVMTDLREKFTAYSEQHKDENVRAFAEHCITAADIAEEYALRKKQDCLMHIMLDEEEHDGLPTA